MTYDEDLFRIIRISRIHQHSLGSIRTHQDPTGNLVIPFANSSAGQSSYLGKQEVKIKAQCLDHTHGWSHSVGHTMLVNPLLHCKSHTVGLTTLVSQWCSHTFGHTMLVTQCWSYNVSHTLLVTLHLITTAFEWVGDFILTKQRTDE